MNIHKNIIKKFDKKWEIACRMCMLSNIYKTPILGKMHENASQDYLDCLA